MGYRIGWPLVKLANTNLGSISTMAMHSGGGNTNGIDGCDTICKTLGSAGINSGWHTPSGTGGDYAKQSIATRCVYKSGSGNHGADKQDWVDYGAAKTCANPMNWCECRCNLPR